MSLILYLCQELELPFIKVAATELVSGVSGESEEKIRDIFDQAKVSSNILEPLAYIKGRVQLPCFNIEAYLWWGNTCHLGDYCRDLWWGNTCDVGDYCHDRIYCVQIWNPRCEFHCVMLCFYITRHVLLVCYSWMKLMPSLRREKPLLKTWREGLCLSSSLVWMVSTQKIFLKLNCFRLHPYLTLRLYRWEEAGKEDEPNLIFLWVTQGTPNSKNCTYFHILARIGKTGFLCKGP